MTAAQDATPLVSVIVPAFNAATTLSETLESVLVQSYLHWQAVVIDDGSNDATSEIARSFVARDARFRLVSIRNSGVAIARNAGIAASSGDLIAPLDADDVWHPDYLETVVALMESKDEPVMAYAACRLIDQATAVIGSGPNFIAAGATTQRMLYCNLVGNGSAIVVRRSALLKAGGYDSRLHAAGAQGCEDYLLQLQLSAMGPIAAAGQHLIGYRVTPDAMSRDPDRMYRSMRMARRLFLEARPTRLSLELRCWIRAQDLLARGHGRMIAGRPVKAAMLLLRAMFFDPVASAAAIGGRLWSLGRGGFKAAATPVPFATLDPDDKAGITLRSSLFVRLQCRRLRSMVETADWGASDNRRTSAIDQP